MFRGSQSSQSGNVVLALFAALGLLGAVGYGYSTLIKGPAQGVQNITARTTSESNIFSAAKILAASSKEVQTAGGDCDADSTIEPFEFRAPGAGVPAPVGGGLIPTGTPAPIKDAWGNEFGYCVWDHGTLTTTNNVAGCGGSTAKRLKGGNVKSEYALAVITAGQDKVFQTTCSAYVNASTPIISKAAGSDDMFVALTYAEAFEASGGAGADLKDIEDSACTTDSVGLLRYEMEVLQVCMADGTGSTLWQEVGAEADTAPGFNPMSNVERNTQYTSNNASFTGFFGTRLATVNNGATIVVNGVAMGQSAQISTTDSVAIRATSATTFSTAKTFTMKISSITRTWVLTTRAATPASFSITPDTRTGMNVAGTTGTAYGTAVTFTLKNNGEATSAGINTIAFSSNTNFEVTGTNNCTGNTLAGGATCTFQVRPKSSLPATYTGIDMTVSASGTPSVKAKLSGSATGWPCTQLSWAGNIANPGGSVTAYEYATAASCNGPCASQTRSCSGGGSLSGSYTNQSCNPLSACTYSWQQGGWGACSVSCGGGTQTQSVWCRRSDGTTVADANCGGGKPATSQTCNTAACPDDYPDPFNFDFQNNLDTNTMTTSNIRQVTGINMTVNISVGPVNDGAQYRICYDAACSSVAAGWSNVERTVTNGLYVQVRRPSSGNWGVTNNSALTIGSYVAAWQMQTSCEINDGTQYVEWTDHIWENSSGGADWRWSNNHVGSTSGFATELITGNKRFVRKAYTKDTYGGKNYKIQRFRYVACS